MSNSKLDITSLVEYWWTSSLHSSVPIIVSWPLCCHVNNSLANRKISHLQIHYSNASGVIPDGFQLFCLYIIGWKITTARECGTKVYTMWVPCDFDRYLSKIITDTDDITVCITSKRTHCRWIETNRRKKGEGRNQNKWVHFITQLKPCASLNNSATNSSAIARWPIGV